MARRILRQEEIERLVNESDEFSSEDDSDDDFADENVSDSDENGSGDESESDDGGAGDGGADDGGPGDGSAGDGRRQAWRNITGKNETLPHFAFSPQRQTISPEVLACVTELDYFQLFFSDELLKNISDETNRYAQEKIQKASPLKPHSQWQNYFDGSLSEMKVFIGVLMNMAINEKPTVKDYFSMDWLNMYPFFSDVFTRDRFLQIFRALHVCPPAPPGSSPLATRAQKIKNIVDYIDLKSRDLYSPGENIAIDESTVGFKGRTTLKMYNPQKPTKWGLRVYVLAESQTGYVSVIEPYFGSATTKALLHPDKPFTERIVLHLLSRLETDCPAEGRHIYTDRFYTSLALADYLYEKKTHFTGTIMPNRKNLPIEVSSFYT